MQTENFHPTKGNKSRSRNQNWFANISPITSCQTSDRRSETSLWTENSFETP